MTYLNVNFMLPKNRKLKVESVSNFIQKGETGKYIHI